MTTKIILQIGADNTKKISRSYINKVVKILSKYWEGFTLTKNVAGYWEGEIEESLSAVIYVLQLVFKDLDDCVKDLKWELHQDAIAYEIEANVDFKIK